MYDLFGCFFWRDWDSDVIWAAWSWLGFGGMGGVGDAKTVEEN